MIPTTKKTSVLQSVQNGLHILQLFTNEKLEWRITDMVNALQLNKSTVSRLVSDLLAEGFLRKEKNTYTLGFSLLSMSGVITSHLEIYRESKDILKTLVAEIEETAHISLLEGKEIIYIHKIDCENPVPLLSSIGKRNPATCTSSGKVLLAFGDARAVDQLIEEGLQKMGPNSEMCPEELKKQLRQVKEQGFSVCIDEMHEDVVSIAAPIRDYTGDVIAAVTVVGTRERIPEEVIHPFAEKITEAANEVSLRLGYLPAIFEGS